MSIARANYERQFGKITKDLEVHHIIPTHAGGTDDVENLVALTKEEHRLAHLIRFYKFGDCRDLSAYYMICYNFTEAHKISSAAGGRVGGKNTKQQNVGIFRDYDERKKWAALGGSAAQNTLKERQVGPFYDPVLRRKVASNGGLASPAFRDSEAQRRRGMIGGKKNAGKKWVNDGQKTFKFLPTENYSVAEYLADNPHLQLGRRLNK